MNLKEVLLRLLIARLPGYIDRDILDGIKISVDDVRFVFIFTPHTSGNKLGSRSHWLPRSGCGKK